MNDGVDPRRAARELAPRVADAAEQIERDGRLPRALIDDLIEGGFFRMCVAAELGGLELDPLHFSEALETLARADASTAWCAMVGATGGSVSLYLPTAGAEEIFGDPRTIVGGVFAPMGTATTVDDGYRVRGQWAFASGVEHSDWMVATSVIDGGAERAVRAMVLPAADLEPLDTWHVAGLRGTGSHDMRADEAFVPAVRSASLQNDPPLRGTTLASFPVFGLLAAGIASVALGNARAALDDVVGAGRNRRPVFSSRSVAERPTAQATLAEAEAQLRAARAFLREAIAGAAAPQATVDERVLLRLAATHATSASARAAQAAWELGGGSAIYERNPLQRRYRDAQVATQHAMVSSARIEVLGRALFGLEIDAAMI